MTNNMTNNIKKLYAVILENQGHVGIETGDGFSLDIIQNDDGYYLEVFEIVPIENTDDFKYVYIDGGQCTGSALDAIDFFEH